MKTSESISKLAEALAKAQGEMDNARKDKDNPFYKSKYADLASVVDACRLALSKHGLSIVQPFDTVDGEIYLTTMLMHLSGEFISSTVMINPVKKDPQGIGSALTYYKRFSLASMAGVASSSEDDDGNAASNNNAPAKPKTPAPVTKPGDFGHLDAPASDW